MKLIIRLGQRLDRVSALGGGERLSLRVSPSISERQPSPRLASFALTHQHREMRIEGTPNFSEFATEMVDLYLRYRNENWPGPHADFVIHGHEPPLCAPEYLTGLNRQG